MVPKHGFTLALILAVWLATPLGAGQLSFQQRGSIFENRATLVRLDGNTAKSPSASLFRDRAGLGLFASIAPRSKVTAPRVSLLHPNARVAHLLDLIAQAEAGGAGYDAVQHGAVVKPSTLPTAMTIAQIYQWIEQTPGQQHAIGRYQFIPSTLKRLVEKQGLSQRVQFTPQVQDLLAGILLEEAGFNGYLTGQVRRADFMLNLAKIWAGLPTATGESYYSGIAGNKATISWDVFDSEMRRIFPS